MNRAEKTYLFHASSGEAEYAFPIIRELKSQRPNCKVVMTYFSDSYIDVVFKNDEIDLVLPLPIDLPGPTRSLLQKYKFSAVLISRTDLWPEFLTQCNSLNIPVILFSRTQKEISNFARKSYYSWLFKKLKFISAVTLQDKKNVLDILPNAKVYTHGDTRWDQVIYKLKMQPNIEFLKPTFVAGSIWPEDFSFLSTAWSKKFGQLVIVPHEKDDVFISSMRNFFKSKDYGVKLLSDCEMPIGFTKLNVDFDVLIVDRFGVLPRLYKNSYGSFVGGSFKRKVHSVMESIGCNTPVIVGPKNQNNREAQLFKKLEIEPGSNLFAVNEAKSSQEIRSLIIKILKNHETNPPEFIELGGSVSKGFLKDFIGHNY